MKFNDFANVLQPICAQSPRIPIPSAPESKLFGVHRDECHNDDTVPDDPDARLRVGHNRGYCRTVELRQKISQQVKNGSLLLLEIATKSLQLGVQSLLLRFYDSYLSALVDVVG
jgi:hypothetical protein